MTQLVQMRALACIIHIREIHTQLQVANSLSHITEDLDLDDVGYFYDPAKPSHIHTVPGQLLAAMNNTKLPSYSFGIASRDTISTLKNIEDDYNKLIIAVTDYAKESDLYYIQEGLAIADDISILIYAIGKKCPELKVGYPFVRVANAYEIEEDILTR